MVLSNYRLGIEMACMVYSMVSRFLNFVSVRQMI